MRWFEAWIKKNPDLHTIKTKPIAQARLDSHIEEDVKNWFKDYRRILEEYKIYKGKNVLNMDEIGARVRCPKGQPIVVPTHIMEAYTRSPENHKSITIIETIQADGREPPLPFIIAPSYKIMENWIASEFRG
jgi:hypothetical protein